MCRLPNGPTIRPSESRTLGRIAMTSAPVTTNNAATVAGIYAAFGRGDVPAIVGRLAEDVAWDDWADNFAQRAGVPDLVPRRGPAEVEAFFAVVSSWTVL